MPVALKPQFLVADTPTTVGLPSRASHRAAEDGPLVGRLRQAGAIVLGKTNVSQLLIYHESDIPVERFLGELDAGRFDAIACPSHAPPALKHGAPASSC